MPNLVLGISTATCRCISGGRGISPVRPANNSWRGWTASSTTAPTGRNRRAQFAIVKKLAADASLEHGLADLNWTRLTGLRAAVAQFFDAPDAQAALGSLDALEITHAPGARTQALLLAGWLGVQLGWEVSGGSPWQPAGFRAQGRPGGGGDLPGKRGAGNRQGGAAGGGRREFRGQPRGGIGVFHDLRALRHGGTRDTQVLPVGPETLADLVSDELVHGGGHRVYVRVVELVRGWL